MKSNTSETRVHRHRAGFMARVERSSLRGAALILEIIIYLVIVALIAVAVTSGVQAIRDLVFTSHAKGDIQNVQTWAEGRYTQDNKYPGATAGGLAVNTGTAAIADPDGAGPLTGTPATAGFTDAPRLTEANGVTNTGRIHSSNGAASGYCITLISSSISDTDKSKFWLISTNPSKIYQSGTATNSGNLTPPSSGITGVTCQTS